MSEIAPLQSFEEKIKERLKRDIGDLIPDEMLTTLIEKSINQIFHEPRIKKNDWGSVLESKPSWFQETVENLLQKEVNRLIRDYIKDHEEDIKAQFTKILETKGPELLANFFIGILVGQQNMMTFHFQSAIQQILLDKNR